jgi:hypothetical protein
MMNFRSNAKLAKLPHSAKLHRLSSNDILVERLDKLDINSKEKAQPGAHETKILAFINEFK